MADNVVAEAVVSAGVTFATDEDVANSRHVPWTKLMFGADGTFTIVSTSDGLPVQITAGQTIAVTNAGTFAVQVDGAALTALALLDDVVYTDDGDWTALSSKHALIGGLYQSTPGTITDGDTGPLRVDENGHLIVNTHSVSSTLTDDVINLIRVHVDQDNEAVYTPTLPFFFDGMTWDRMRGDSTNGLLVNLGANNDVVVTNAGTFAVQAAQSGTWNITNISGTISLPTGAATLTEQQTQSTALAAIQTAVQLLDNAVSGNELQVDVLTLPNVTLAAGTNTNEVVGDAAHDAAVAGNPVLIGLEARSTDGTAVGSGDAVRALATLLGKLVTYPYALPGSTWGYATATAGVTDTADDVAQAAGGAGVRHYITSVQVINGHATVSTEVVIKDGTTVLWRGWAQAGGGGCAAKFDPPLRGTAATAVNVANITTGSQTYFNLQGFSSSE